MRTYKQNFIIPALSILLFAGLIGCSSHGNKNSFEVKQMLGDHRLGSYGYDKAFLKEQNIEFIELSDSTGRARIMLVPGYQGRVMTSTADGDAGYSYGWLNYRLLGSKEVNPQFNPVGGEERFWLGPEGGPFSIYFKQGKEQIYNNWVVPPVIDTEEFMIDERTDQRVVFSKGTKLTNSSGFQFDLGIQRIVSLLPSDSLCSFLNADVPTDMFGVVAYESINTITNKGTEAWKKETGLLSIWMLSMFNPSESTTVFIPFNSSIDGVVVNDEYFGKVPADRLIVDQGMIYFKIDGKYRSKIGVPPGRATELAGSYDSEKNLLTLVWCNLPREQVSYVNSQWGEQEDPYSGDVINAYNDGPVEDGSIMGPFYEIETSSPAADLEPGESITHIQRIVHIQGDELDMAKLMSELLNINLYSLKSKFPAK